MKEAITLRLLRLFLIGFSFSGMSIISSTAQVVADFYIPDTACVNNPVPIINTSINGSTYYWNFCSGNANTDPIGENIGNPGGLLTVPTYITLVKQVDEHFSFVSCQGVGIIRYYHGSSFNNFPQNSTNLGKFGIISDNEEGIQIKYDNGKWLGFICSDEQIIRLNFGASLWNTPIASVLKNVPPQNMLHGLSIVQEGKNWIGFATCSLGNNLIRLNFGASLMNDPNFKNLGNLAAFDGPGAICLLYNSSQPIDIQCHFPSILCSLL